MQKKNLAAHALHFIYRFWQKHDHRYPSSREIANELKISVNQWDGIRKQLFEAGLLKDSVWKIQFTPDGLKEMKECDTDEVDIPVSTKQASDIKPGEKINSVQPIHDFIENALEIPLLGMVMAGPGDNLKAYGGDETFSIPAFDNLPPTDKLTLWQVEGTSMLHEGINPDDYIITEKVSIWEIKDDELIITYYLPEKYARMKQDEIDLARQDPENFSGPTLKYYKLMHQDKKDIARLSWQSELENNPNPIFTRALDSDRIWRVVAVYAPEKFRFYNKRAARS